MSLEAWMWTSEHEQDQIFLKIFYWYQRNIKTIFFDTTYNISWHGGIFCHMYIDEQNKLDEKIKWMNTTCSQPGVMCHCKLYLFTTKRFVSIEALHDHF